MPIDAEQTPCATQAGRAACSIKQLVPPAHMHGDMFDQAACSSHVHGDMRPGELLQLQHDNVVERTLAVMPTKQVQAAAIFRRAQTCAYRSASQGVTATQLPRLTPELRGDIAECQSDKLQ
jgi:hypothetical protein